MNSQAIHCIMTRRSIRSLKPDPIPEKDIEQLLKCLEAAPSAGNLQPWLFCVVTDPVVKEQLCRLSFDQQVVMQAPVVIAVCALPEESAREYGDVGRNLFAIQDTAAATQNLLLAAHALGYGAVWIGVVKQQQVAACLGLTEGIVPVALVPVGQANETPKPMERKGWETVTRRI